MNGQTGALDSLIGESTIPEWTALLRELQTTLTNCGGTNDIRKSNNQQHNTRKQHRQQQQPQQPQQQQQQQQQQRVPHNLLARLRTIHTQIHAALPLIEYARTSVARLVMRQIASETQEMIIKDVLSRRTKPLPQGSGTLDSIDGLGKKGVRLTAAEKKKMDKILADLDINDREFALFRTFREHARDTAHPELQALPQDALSFTALDHLHDDPKLEGYGREVLDVYWRALRYFSGLSTDGKTRKNKSEQHGIHTAIKVQHNEKIDRFALREELEELPSPPFPAVVEAVFKLGTARRRAAQTPHPVVQPIVQHVAQPPPKQITVAKQQRATQKQQKGNKHGGPRHNKTHKRRRQRQY